MKKVVGGLPSKGRLFFWVKRLLLFWFFLSRGRIGGWIAEFVFLFSFCLDLGRPGLLNKKKFHKF